MGLSELTQDELKARIVAARSLRNLDQEDIGKEFERDGLGSTTPGRLERGLLTLNRSRLEALKRHLRVPEEWFTRRAAIVELDLGDGKVTDLPQPRPWPSREEVDQAVRRTQAGAATHEDYVILVRLAAAAGAELGADESPDEADHRADTEPRP